MKVLAAAVLLLQSSVSSILPVAKHQLRTNNRKLHDCDGRTNDGHCAPDVGDISTIVGERVALLGHDDVECLVDGESTTALTTKLTCMGFYYKIESAEPIGPDMVYGVECNMFELISTGTMWCSKPGGNRRLDDTPEFLRFQENTSHRQMSEDDARRLGVISFNGGPRDKIVPKSHFSPGDRNPCDESASPYCEIIAGKMCILSHAGDDVSTMAESALVAAEVTTDGGYLLPHDNCMETISEEKKSLCDVEGVCWLGRTFEDVTGAEKAIVAVPVIVAPPTPSPVSPTPSPVSPTPSPVSPTPSPVSPTRSPVIPLPLPVVIPPTRAPVAPTRAPVAPTRAPVAPTRAPVAPTRAPVAPTRAPVSPTRAPVSPTRLPTPAPVAVVADALEREQSASIKNRDRDGKKILALAAIPMALLLLLALLLGRKKRERAVVARSTRAVGRNAIVGTGDPPRSYHEGLYHRTKLGSKYLSTNCPQCLETKRKLASGEITDSSFDSSVYRKEYRTRSSDKNLRKKSSSVDVSRYGTESGRDGVNFAGAGIAAGTAAGAAGAYRMATKGSRTAGENGEYYDTTTETYRTSGEKIGGTRSGQGYETTSDTRFSSDYTGALRDGEDETYQESSKYRTTTDEVVGSKRSYENGFCDTTQLCQW